MTAPTNVIVGDRTTDAVALRAYFERLLMEQDRLRQTELAGLRIEIMARLDAMDKAVILQLDAKEAALRLKSSELDRRLELLNGEAGRLAKVLAESVPREVWSESNKAMDVWRAGVDKQLNTLAGQRQGVALFWGVIIGSVGLLGMIVALVAR